MRQWGIYDKPELRKNVRCEPKSMRVKQSTRHNNDSHQEKTGLPRPRKLVVTKTAAYRQTLG